MSYGNIGNQKLVLGNYHYNRHSAESFFHILEECSINRIELCPYASWLDITDRENTKRFAKELHSRGIQVETLVLEFGGVVPFNIGLELSDVENWSIEYAKKVIENMSELGVEKLVIGAGRQSEDLPLEECWARSKKNLRMLGRYASERGVMILLAADGSNNFSNVVKTTDEQIRMLKEVGLSNVRAYADNISMTSAGEDFVESFGKLMSIESPKECPNLGNLVGHVCISDGPGGWMLPGDGILGKEKLITDRKAVKAAGYMGSITCRLAHWQYDFTPDHFTRLLKRFWDGH